MRKKSIKNIYSVSDVGVDIKVVFGLRARVLFYFKTWLLPGESTQSNYKEKTDIFLELVTNLNYDTLTATMYQA